MDSNKPNPWPDGCVGAISLTFDDGLPSHLEVAIPLLDEYGFKGTFYISPRGDDWLDRLKPWSEAAESGHEIGNHSLTHPCSSNFSDDPESPSLDKMTIKEIESDIMEAQKRLRILIPNRKNWTYAYPCYEAFVGRGENRRSYVPIIARHFIAARGRGEYANSPITCDLHYLWSWPAHRMSSAQLIGLVEQAVARGRWGILTFHGICEGHLPTSEHDLRKLLEYLDRNRRRIWVATVSEVAERILRWRKTANISVRP